MAYRLILGLFMLPVFIFGQRIDVQKITVRENIVLRGRSIDSFSVDGTFNSPSNLEIPTQKAIYDYILGITAGLAYLPIAGGTLTGTGGAGFIGFPSQGSVPATPGAGIRMFANSASNLAVVRADGYVTTFDFSTATGNRFFTYPANAGTFGILENVQSWTGANTFTPTGSGGAGFIYSSTTRPAHPFGNATTANRDAMTGTADGDVVFNSTTGRPNFRYSGAWVEVPTMASGGLGNNQIARGDAFGNLQSSSNLTYNTFLHVNPTSGTTSARFSPTGDNSRGIEINFTGGVDKPAIQPFAGAVSFTIQGAGLALGGADNKVRFVTTSAAIPFAVFTGQTYFGANSSGIEILANGHRGGFYSANADGNTETFTFDAAGGSASSSTDYFRIRRNASNFFSIRGSGFFGFGSATPTSFAHFAPPASNVTGDLSGAGYGLRFAPATYTNTTTGAAGTVAAASAYSFGVPTIVSTNAGITYTTIATVRIDGAPTMSTNSSSSGTLALWIAGGNSYFQGQILATGKMTALEYNTTTATSGYFSTDSNLGMALSGGNVQLNVFSGSVIFRKMSSGGSTMGLVNTVNSRLNGNVAAEIITGPESSDFRYSTQTTIGDGANGIDLLVKGGDAKGNSGASVNISGDLILQGGYHSGGTLGSGWDNGQIIFKTTQNISAATPTVRGVIDATGAMALGASSVTAGAIFELVSTTAGFLAPRMTMAQRNAISMPPSLLEISNTTTGRKNLYFSGAWWAGVLGPDGGIPLHQISVGDASGNLVSSINFRYNAGLLTTGTTDFRLGNWSTATTANLLARRNIVGYWHSPTSFSTGLAAQDSTNQRYTTFVSNSTDGSIISKNGATGAQTSFVVTPTETTTDNKAVFTSAVYTSGTTSSSGTSYNIPGNVNYAHVDGTTIVTVNLPEIVASPDINANQVGVGASIDLSIANSLAVVTVNRSGSSDLIIVGGMTTTPAASFVTITGTTFTGIARAVAPDLWVIY